MWGSLLSRPLLMQGIGLVGARVSVHVEIQLGDILTLVLQLPLLLALALLSSFPNGAPIQLYDVQRFKTGNVIVASKEEDFTVLRGFLNLVTSQCFFKLNRVWKADFARELRLGRLGLVDLLALKG